MKNRIDKEVTEANMELGKKLEDSELKESMEHGTSESNLANMKIQKAFYGNDDNSKFVPTYIYNETPAIKITGDDD